MRGSLRWKILAPTLLALMVVEGALFLLPDPRYREAATVVALPLIMATALMGAVLLVVVQRATEPLLEVADAARRAHDGDLERRVPVRTTDEVGELARAFNGMLDGIAAREAQVRRYADDLERSGHDFQAAMDTLSSTLAHATDPREVMDKAVSESVRILGSDAAFLFTCDGDNGSLEAAAPVHVDHRPVPVSGTLLEAVVHRERHVLYDNGDRASPGLPSDLPLEVGSALAVPLRVTHRVEGVLLLVATPGGRRFTEQDVPKATIFARTVGIAMRNARLLEETRAERAKYQAVVETANDGILLRVDDDLVFANPALQTMLGTSDFPMKVARFFAEHVDPSALDDLRARYRHRRDGDLGPMRYETRFRATDGTIVPVEISSNIITYEGRIASQMFVRDLTVQKRNEEELKHRSELLYRHEKLAAIGQVAAGVAHEINNPLAFIKGNEQLSDDIIQEVLADPALSPAARRALTEIREGVEMNLNGIRRIESIVSSLRQFAKPSRERESVDVNRLITETLVLSRNRLKQGAIDLTTDLPEWLPPVWGNPDRIGQVLLNLVMNALDAVPEDGPRLTVRAMTDGGDVVVEVVDNGPGIPEDVAGRLFDPFFTTKKSGTGLGLAISHRIVEEHRGLLEHEPAPGGGTLFRMRLPQGSGEAVPAPATPVAEGE